MKEVKMFVLENCPHCRRAKEMIDELFVRRPEYKSVSLVVVDEGKDPKTAEKYDYFYVPTFFVGDEKIAEGVPTEEGVERAFETAYRG